MTPDDNEAARAWRWRRSASSLFALVVQVLAAFFFIFDSLFELATDPDKRHPLTEFPVALALCLGVWFTFNDLKQLLRQKEAAERTLALASGAFRQVIDRQFALWRFTPAERDVAWLVLKGVDVTEIATLRRAANGTVRAQMARIYGKSGVTSRAQFASIFVDALMGHLPERLDDVAIETQSHNKEITP
ncbi:helix-turn-helix transcriptional regulator [Rhodobacter sp. KR11]|jgi:DNA-binding CsgD family transcriptional regulator|uniref:helix-turn-helix transcriptional regulator n=1 Tax=Rhodobacter sp. KR11 TaxID=2974588 RepID=UPI0022215694|nr:helix-turn-helix transcriptional regulator [Rhodobacter sp. KR11]MCW1918188.1 helix-turn-helix transcriptional regulator [Rhodobacter sp. KR11]